MENINLLTNMLNTNGFVNSVASSENVDAAVGVASFDDLILQLLMNNIIPDDKSTDLNSLLMSMVSVNENNDENDDNKIDLYSELMEYLSASQSQNVHILENGIINVEPIVADDIQTAPVSLSNAIFEETDIVNVVNETTEPVDGIQIPNKFVNNEATVSTTEVKIVESEVEDVEDVADDNMISDRTTDNGFANSIKSKVSSFVNTDTNIDTKVAIGAYEKNNESENSDFNSSRDDIDYQFVSTADMLKFRNSGSLHGINTNAMFKVAQPPVNIEAPNAVNDLANRIIMKMNDENSFEIELFPENLGKVSISLKVEDGILRLVMSGENEKVNNFLATQSANIKTIVEKHTDYNTVVRVDEPNEQFAQRDNTQQSADDAQRERQERHLRQMYAQKMQSTDDFLSILNAM